MNIHILFCRRHFECGVCCFRSHCLDYITWECEILSVIFTIFFCPALLVLDVFDMLSSLRVLASNLENSSRIGKAGWVLTLSISVGMLNETVQTQQEQLHGLTDPVPGPGRLSQPGPRAHELVLEIPKVGIIRAGSTLFLAKTDQTSARRIRLGR